MGEDTCFSLQTWYYFIILHEALEPAWYWYLWQGPTGIGVFGRAGRDGDVSQNAPFVDFKEDWSLTSFLQVVVEHGPFPIMLDSC